MSRVIEEYKLIDVKLGQRIEELRVSAGLTREQIADAVGVSHQQIQKNLKGINRISANRIPTIAQLLNVSIEDLFNEINNFIPTDNESDRLLIDVVREFRSLNRKSQHSVASLLKTMNKGK